MKTPDIIRNGVTINRRFSLWLYYGIRLLMALAFVLFLLSGNWFDAFSTALIFILMIVPSIIKKRYDFYLPFDLEVAIVVYIFLALFLGSLNDYYERFSLLDSAVHFQSGLLLGIVGFVLVYVLNEQKTKKLELSPGFISFFAVTFSMAIGVLWEIYEYIIDLTLGFTMQKSGLPDTMGDMIVSTAGAIVVGILGYLWMKHHRKLPFTPRRLSGHQLTKPSTKAEITDQKT